MYYSSPWSFGKFCLEGTLGFSRKSRGFLFSCFRYSTFISKFFKTNPMCVKVCQIIIKLLFWKTNFTDVTCWRTPRSTVNSTLWPKLFWVKRSSTRSARARPASRLRSFRSPLKTSSPIRTSRSRKCSRPETNCC